MELRKERIDRGIKARCEDIYALLSLKEIFYVIGPKSLFVIFLLLIPLLRPFIGDYWERVFFITCLMALLSISWELLFSIGLVSLGQALLFGVGAYLSSIFNTRFHFPVFLSVLLASLSGGFFCALILFPASRIKGIYFSMITLCIPILLCNVIKATGILGGTSGISGVGSIGNYYLELFIPSLILMITVFSLRRFMDTDTGMLIRGIKHNEFSLMTSGINVPKLKFWTIFFAAVIGSFSGSYVAHYYQFVGISAFSLDYSIIPLACSILGGINGFFGSITGAFIICPLSEILREAGTLRIVIYSSILIIFILFVPEGIFSYLSRKYHQLERWKEI